MRDKVRNLLKKPQGLMLLLIILSTLIVIPFIPAQEPIALDSNNVPSLPIAFEETDDYIRLDNGLTFIIEFYKDSAGYNKIYYRNGSVLVHDDRVTVEYLAGNKWKQRGTPIDLSWVKLNDGYYEVTRHYTDYLGTTFNVTYSVKVGDPIKITVNLDSGQTDEYRISWALSGITSGEYSPGDHKAIFGDNGTDVQLAFDWSDAYQEFGDIATASIETKANGKKITINFEIGVIEEGQILTLDPTIIDYNDEEVTALIDLSRLHPSSILRTSAVSQSFTTPDNNYFLTSVKFKLFRNGNPTGNAYAKLYAHTGTYGTSSEPTGAVLATSDAFNIAGVTDVWPGTFHELTFTGAQQYEMQANTYYVIVFENPASGNIDDDNSIYMMADGLSGHDGNWARYYYSDWYPSSGVDCNFYVYGTLGTVEDPIESDWLEGWYYRKSHEIEGSTAGEVTDYQIRFNVHYESTSDINYYAFAENGVSQPFNWINMPSAVYYNDTTYIAWQGGDESCDPYIIAYNHSAETWSGIVKIAENPLYEDDHGCPAIIIDANGYLHVFYAGHGSDPLKHAKSDDPLSIAAWTIQADIDSSAVRPTYPHLIQDGNNMYVFYRYYAGSLNSPVSYKKSEDNGATWGARTTVINFGNSKAIYPGMMERNGTEIHMTWVYHDYGDAKRKNIYHAYLDTSDGKMYSMDGTDLGAYVDKTEADADCRVVNSGSYVTQVSPLHLDESGYPHIIYTIETETGFEWRHIYWSGVAWESSILITETDNTFNFADFILTSSSDIEAYLTTSGLAGRGGDIDKWTWNGAAWSEAENILTEKDRPLNIGSVPLDFDSSLKLVFCEVIPDEYIASNLKVYAYGSDFTEKGDLSENVYMEENCRTDFGDVRFTTSDGLTELDYWIQEKVNGEYAIIWVEVDRIPEDPDSAQIYMYYGNSAVTTTSNGVDTFIYFNEFIANLTISEVQEGAAEWYHYFDIPDIDGENISFDWTFLITDSATHKYGTYLGAGPRNNTGSGAGSRLQILGPAVACDTDSAPLRQISHQYYNRFEWSGLALVEDFVYHIEDIFDGNDTTVLMIYNPALGTVWSNGESESLWSNSESVLPTFEIIVFQPAGGYRGDALHSCTYDAVNDRLLFDYRSGDGARVAGWFDTLRIRQYVNPEPTHGSWVTEEEIPELDIININADEWVFEGKTRYDFEVTFVNITLSTVIQVGMRFTDSIENTHIIWYDQAAHALTVTSPEDSISGWLKSMEQEGSNVLAIFQLMFNTPIPDSYNLTVSGRIVTDVDTGWLVTSGDPFHIYNLGGLSTLTASGTAGRVTGGDIFELYAADTRTKNIVPPQDFDVRAVPLPEGWQWLGIQLQEAGDEQTLLEEVEGWKWWLSTRTENRTIHPTNRKPNGAGTDDITYVSWPFGLKIKANPITSNGLMAEKEFWRKISPSDNELVTVEIHAMTPQTTGTTGKILITDDGYVDDLDAGAALDSKQVVDLVFSGNGSIRLTDGAAGYIYPATYTGMTWYNFTFVINCTAQSYDMYVDEVLNATGIDFRQKVAGANSVGHITCMDMSMAGNFTEFYIDDLWVYTDFDADYGGVAKATMLFKHLQHWSMDFDFFIENGQVYAQGASGTPARVDDDYSNLGYLELGWDIMINETWAPDFLIARISIVDGYLSGKNDWIKFNVTWYQHGEYIKHDYLYGLFEGYSIFPGSAKDTTGWHWDIWFNRANASTVVGARLNTEYYGMSDKSVWWAVWSSNWQPMRTEVSESTVFIDLDDVNGTTHSAKEVLFIRSGVKVYRNTEAQFAYKVLNIAGLDFPVARDTMSGIDTPPIRQTVVPDVVSGFFGSALGSIFTAALKRLSNTIGGFGLSLFTLSIEFIDNIFAALGYPALVSTIFTWMDSLFSSVPILVGYGITFIGQIFLLISTSAGNTLNQLSGIITIWIGMYSSIMDLLTGVLTPGINLWNDLGINSFIRIGAVLYPFWLLMMGMDQGAQAVIDHLNGVLNIGSFFLNFILNVAGFFMGLMDMLIGAIRG